MSVKYGPFVRLWGIHPSLLPAETASTEDLTAFLSAVLSEAVPFIRSVPSSSDEGGPWKLKGSKNFSHSAAPVDMYERTVSAEELRLVAKENHLPQLSGTKPAAETWFLRRSVHEDAKKQGTADWDEWTASFKEGHAEAEMQFTPTVTGTELKRRWDCSGVADVRLDDGDGGGGGDTWGDLTLRLEESVHKMPAPLDDRVFPVLQATASARGRREFVVVQMAVVPSRAEEEKEPKRPDGALRGAYTSVERFREAGGGGSVEWIMGTVSDARGVLPGWVQKMAVPGKIAKDVDMFLEWIVEERKKER